MTAFTTRVGYSTTAMVLFLGCSEGAPPTQPAERAETPRAASVPAMAPRTDVASAALPTVISACYVDGKGTIYRIKAAGTPTACDKKDTEFTWTDPGATAGLITGLTFHSASTTIPTGGRINFACDEGQSVINFGYEPLPGNDTQPRASRPTLTSVGIRWVFVGTAGTEWVFYWTCANAAPAVAYQAP